jgi:soluble lytic murein transglycosylase-like protein
MKKMVKAVSDRVAEPDYAGIRQAADAETGLKAAARYLEGRHESRYDGWVVD